MKLYNTMQDIVSVHRKCTKHNMSNTFYKDGYALYVSPFGIELRRPAKDDYSTEHTSFIINNDNGITRHKNNITTNSQNNISSFFRMSSGSKIDICSKQDSNTIEVPTYNDNEDELLFTLSTIMSGELPLVLISILMTLSTKLCTVYSYHLTYEEIDILNDFLQEAKAWAIEHIQML